MTSKGIIPDAVYGGIVVSSLPAPSGVTNAYVPPDTFTVSVPLTFYGGNCSANRFDPQQLNAFESEMLSFAATLAPNGTWNAASVGNLSAAFQTWSAGFSGGISLATSANYPASAASNITAATPAYVGAAVSAAIGTGLVRAQASNWPASAADDSKVTTPAYVGSAITGSLLLAADYPSQIGNVVKPVSGAFVGAAITSATTSIESTVEALIPALTPGGSYPSSSNSSAATPGYVAAAIGAISVPGIAHFADYPDVTDDTKVTTPKYVAAAIAALGTPSFAALSDVLLTSVANSDIPAYNTSASKWENVKQSFNISLTVGGVTTSSEILLQFIAPTAFQLPASLTGSYAIANTAATASTTFTIKKNGTSIGTIVWAIAGTTATFTFTAAVSFAAGDILQLVAPSSADATLADIGITLAGYKI